METVNKIKGLAEKVLTYFRINDEKKRVSLTNIALIVIIYKLAMTDATTFTDITGLAVAVLGYQFKRFVDK